MRLSGDRVELGNWEQGTGTHIMHRSANLQKWMGSQYGKLMRPYETTIVMKQLRQSSINEPIFFNYHYSIGNVGREFIERSGTRLMKIIDPSLYGGQLSKDRSQVDKNEVFIVNGHLEKCDGNYIPNFNVQELKEVNVFVGPYPHSAADIASLRHFGITAAMNVMTVQQMLDRHLDWN